MKSVACRGALLAGLPASAEAHVFAQPYTLPVPLTVYVASASAALLLSFAIAGLFIVAPLWQPTAVRRGAAADRARHGAGPLVAAGRLVSVALLLLCIVSGMAGSQNAFLNFNMTFFWIGFVLVVPYLVAVVGDFYAPLNPWKAIVLLLQDGLGVSFAGRVVWPARLGCVPALVLYMAFIWLELFGQLLPRGLSIALGVYTLVNIAGAYLFGIDAWFRQGEFFAVFLRLIGKMSPRARPWDPAETAPADGRRWRWPFVGLLDEPAGDLSLVVFILFMLSSTAFDGLHSTLPWASLYWKHLYPLLLEPLLRAAPAMQMRASTQLYYAWQWVMLAASPFVYLLVFSVAVRGLRTLARSTLPVKTLLLRFAMPLVPIAFVYHLTHYYTLVFAQGGQLLRLVSDPLAHGWNVFGTAALQIDPVMLDVGNIWLTQVGLILLGHIVSVCLSHIEALRLFATPRRAASSQLPMLVLMIAFTNLGLWILSLPIAGG